jgi:hypothetical protein
MPCAIDFRFFNYFKPILAFIRFFNDDLNFIYKSAFDFALADVR